MHDNFPHSIFHILHSKRRSAFTLIETLIVISLIAILSIVSFLFLFGRRNSADLVNARSGIVGALREAQSRSFAQDQNVSWGVHFSNITSSAPFYALFYSSYAATRTAAYYSLPPSVAYITSTLAVGSSVDITFAQISGISSASTSIGLYSKTQSSLSSSVISVASSGAVSF